MLIFDFGKNLSIARIGNKNQFDVHTDVISYDVDLFKSADNVKELLSYLYPQKDDIEHEVVYISLSGGCGIQYKTFAVALDAFMVNGSRTTKAEQIETILEVCRNRLSPEYTPCVINVYTTDTDYIMSVGYIPSNYLENIQTAFESYGVSVFDIKPLGSFIYQIINKEVTNQIIVSTDNELMLVNSLGFIGWSKPFDFDSARDNELVRNYLVSQSEALYKIDDKIAGTKLINIDNIHPYLNVEYDGEINSCVLVALALTKQQKAELKGGMNDVANKFRLIFNKGKNQGD